MTDKELYERLSYKPKNAYYEMDDKTAIILNPNYKEGIYRVANMSLETKKYQQALHLKNENKSTPTDDELFEKLLKKQATIFAENETEIETIIQNTLDREVSSEKIGELVMEKLKTIDQVAYVRFASVYRQFTDVNTFVAEIEKLLITKKN